jgi:hypothetical protein
VRSCICFAKSRFVLIGFWFGYSLIHNSLTHNSNKNPLRFSR